MKKRKGFRPIIVKGIRLQYCVSLAKERVIFYKDDIKYEVPFVFGLTTENSWRGKHAAGGWGKRQVAALFSNYYKTT